MMATYKLSITNEVQSQPTIKNLQAEPQQDWSQSKKPSSKKLNIPYFGMEDISVENLINRFV
jgi:hypothetical protein